MSDAHRETFLPARPHYKKLIPEPGTFHLVRDEAACEVLLKHYFQQAIPEVRSIWICELPQADATLGSTVYGILVVFMLDAGAAERWLTTHELEVLSTGLPEPKPPECLDTITWATEELAELTAIRKLRAAPESSGEGTDPLAGRAIGVADALLKHLKEVTSLLNYYRDSRPQWQESCAAAANKFADERDHAQGVANQLAEEVGKLREGIKELRKALELVSDTGMARTIEAEEAKRALRRLRGEHEFDLFCGLVPHLNEVFTVEGPARDALIERMDCGAVRPEDISAVTIEDTYLDTEARIRVCYFARGSSFPRFFTARQIEAYLRGALRPAN